MIFPNRHGSGRRAEEPTSWRQRGLAAATEVTLLVPVVVLLLGLFGFGWRVHEAQSHVTAATQFAARAAALAPAPKAGDSLARASLAANLAQSRCSDVRIVTDTRDLAKPAGIPGLVRVQASCTVSMSDLLVPGIPGTITVSATGSNPISTYREGR